MSGTPNPSLNIRELNGNLIVSTNTGEGTLLGIGCASAGPRNVPVPASQLSTVNGFGVGPLVSSIGAHIDNTNRRAYLFQVDYDTAGTFGAVVKQPFTSPQSPSVLSLSAASFSARTDGMALPFGSGALNISTGFLNPPSPLPLTIVTAGGSAAQVITIRYYDDAGAAQTATISAPTPGSGDRPAEVHLTTSSTGLPAVRFLGRSYDYNEARIVQDLNLNVRDYTSMRLQVDVLIHSQDLFNCGDKGTECPIMLRMIYLDADGNQQQWIQGFYVLYSPTVGKTYCADCALPRPEHEQLRPGEWTNWQSPELLGFLRSVNRPMSV